MAIGVQRARTSAIPFLRRYEAHVTPPHAPEEWRSPQPLPRRQIEKKLYGFGNQTADIAAAFEGADAD